MGAPGSPSVVPRSPGGRGAAPGRVHAARVSLRPQSPWTSSWFSSQSGWGPRCTVPACCSSAGLRGQFRPPRSVVTPRTVRPRLPAGLTAGKRSCRQACGVRGSGGPVRGAGREERAFGVFGSCKSATLVFAADPGSPRLPGRAWGRDRRWVRSPSEPIPTVHGASNLGLWDGRWECKCRGGGAPGGSGRVTAGQTGCRARPELQQTVSLGWV